MNIMNAIIEYLNTHPAVKIFNVHGRSATVTLKNNQMMTLIANKRNITIGIWTLEKAYALEINDPGFFDKIDNIIKDNWQPCTYWKPPTSSTASPNSSSTTDTPTYATPTPP